METFELIPLQNGIMSLRSLDHRETFHPGIGPMEEAQALHVEQQRLSERFLASPALCLWDVGLGAGANALAAIRAIQSQNVGKERHLLTLHSFDRSIDSMEFALKNAHALGYLQGFEKDIATLLTEGRVRMGETILWKLHLGDFCKLVATEPLAAPDAIFYDPYSPKANPHMWSLEHFSRLHSRLDPSRPCLWTNYTRSTAVRVSLLLAGFYVGIGCSIHQKAETTVATNHLKSLVRPLDRRWLEKKVRISRNSAPLRGEPYQDQVIGEVDYECLMRHPQFS